VLFQLLVVALVGGSARPWGALVGALVITELSQYLSRAAGDRPGIAPLIFAAAFLVMALAMPRGISGAWARLVTARRSSGDDVDESIPPPERPRPFELPPGEEQSEAWLAAGPPGDGEGLDPPATAT